MKTFGGTYKICIKSLETWRKRILLQNNTINKEKKVNIKKVLVWALVYYI